MSGLGDLENFHQSFILTNHQSYLCVSSAKNVKKRSFMERKIKGTNDTNMLDFLSEPVVGCPRRRAGGK